MQYKDTEHKNKESLKWIQLYYSQKVKVKFKIQNAIQYIQWYSDMTVWYLTKKNAMGITTSPFLKQNLLKQKLTTPVGTFY